MPASLGYHPGFRWPLPYGQPRAEHFIEFETDESKNIRRLDASGMLTPDRHPSPVVGRRLALDDSLFRDDVVIFDEIHSHSVTYGASGFTIASISFWPLPISSDHGMYYLSWICCVALLFLARNLIQSRIGRAFVALRDHEIAAQSLGIYLLKYKALAFALSGFYAGVAGVLFAGLLTFIGPESFGLQQMVLQLAAMVMVFEVPYVR